MAYGRGFSPEEDAISAEVGRVRIGKFTMQFDDSGAGPYYCRENGKVSVTAFFFGPEETPEGIDPETGILVRSYPNFRFAEVPAELLPQAEPMAQPERTQRLLERWISKAGTMPTAPSDDPSMEP